MYTCSPLPFLSCIKSCKHLLICKTVDLRKCQNERKKAVTKIQLGEFKLVWLKAAFDDKFLGEPEVSGVKVYSEA